MKEKNSGHGATAGIGFSGLLTIAFIVLKLTKVIDWKWIWVLSPVWISIGLVIVTVLVFIIAIFLKNIIKHKN